MTLVTASSHRDAHFGGRGIIEPRHQRGALGQPRHEVQVAGLTRNDEPELGMVQLRRHAQPFCSGAAAARAWASSPKTL